MRLTVNEIRLGLTAALKEKILNAVGFGFDVLAVARPMQISTAGSENVVLVRVDGELKMLSDEGNFVSDVDERFLDVLIEKHEDALVGLQALRKELRFAQR